MVSNAKRLPVNNSRFQHRRVFYIIFFFWWRCPNTFLNIKFSTNFAAQTASKKLSRVYKQMFRFCGWRARECFCCEHKQSNENSFVYHVNNINNDLNVSHFEVIVWWKQLKQLAGRKTPENVSSHLVEVSKLIFKHGIKVFVNFASIDKQH